MKLDGTPRKSCFCRTPELIENYSEAVADTTQTWVCHHRLETHNSDGERLPLEISRKELQALDMYFDRPPEELVFMTKSEHIRLHCIGRIHSQDVKNRISKTEKGKVVSEETRNRIKKSLEGRVFTSTKVVCIETGEVFESATLASLRLGLGPSAVRKSIFRNGACAVFHWKYLGADA